MRGSTVLLPKVDSPQNPGEFRLISILNANGRLFHSSSTVV